MKKYRTGAGTAETSDMKAGSHTLILIIVALLFFSAASVHTYFSILPKPLFVNTADTTVSKSTVTDFEFDNSVVYRNETSADAPENGETSLVNINTATLEELVTLDGIGTVKAQAIIDYRENNGDFISVRELCNVEGIGEKVLEKIIDKITV